MKKELEELLESVKEFRTTFLGMNCDDFNNLYFSLFEDVIMIYTDDIISKEMYRYLKRKLWAIKNSYFLIKCGEYNRIDKRYRCI